MAIYITRSFQLLKMLPRGGHVVVRLANGTPDQVIEELADKELGYPIKVDGYFNQPLEIGDIVILSYHFGRTVYVVYVKPDLDAMLKAARGAGMKADTRLAWLNPMIQPEEGDEDDPRRK